MGTRADADFIGFSFYFFVRRNVHFCNSLFPNVAGGSQRHEYEAIKPLSGDRYGDSISKLKSCFPSEGGQNTGRVKKKKKKNSSAYKVTLGRGIDQRNIKLYFRCAKFLRRGLHLARSERSRGRFYRGPSHELLLFLANNTNV